MDSMFWLGIFSLVIAFLLKEIFVTYRSITEHKEYFEVQSNTLNKISNCILKSVLPFLCSVFLLTMGVMVSFLIFKEMWHHVLGQ
jgi:hypothetical protein